MGVGHLDRAEKIQPCRSLFQTSHTELRPEAKSTMAPFAKGPMDLVPTYSSYTASGTCLDLSETEGPGA